MPRLSNVDRERAIGMLNAGRSKRYVAGVFGCSRWTIHKLWNRLQQTGSTSDRPRPGRQKVTTPAQDRRIRTLHLRNRQKTATSTSNELFRGQVSAQTVRRRLHAFNIRARRPYVGPILRRNHRQLRLLWAQQHLRWTQRQWNQIMFSDESRYNLSSADGRVRVWRRTGERFADACVVEKDRFGGGSCMVWGGILGNQKTDLIVVRGTLTARRYVDDIVTPAVLPFIARHGPGVTFQHDNATSHSARLTTNFLQANGVNVLPWPSRSPDLNCIEHLWDELGKRVRTRVHQPQTLNELERALVEEWRRIPANVIRRLTTSMRRRCQAVVDARGAHTRF